jgi:hypothetical protein
VDAGGGRLNGCSEERQAMGVERAVTRWYVQRQRLLMEIAALERSLSELTAEAARSSAPPSSRIAQQRARLEAARERLRLLGPCPKPMMG